MTSAKRASLFDVLSSIQAAHLRPADKLILLYLSWRQGHNGIAWPSLATIASDLHIHRRTCLRSIARLCGSDCVKKTSGRCGRGHSNRYVVLARKRGRVDTFSKAAKGGPLTVFDAGKGGQMSPEIGSMGPLKEQGKEPSASALRAPPSGAPGNKGKAKTKTRRRQNPPRFVPPTAEQVRAFAATKGYPDFDAQKFIDYYELGNWHDSQGRAVHNWKQKLLAVWLKPAEAGRGAEQDIGKLAGCEPTDEDEARELLQEVGSTGE